MKQIFKYRLPRDGETITINAHIVKWLEIHEQHGWPHIWAIIDDAMPDDSWTIIAWGTGWEVPEEVLNAEYLGTAQDGAGYIWHYFGEVAAFGYATATTEYEWNPSDYTLTTTGCPVEPYSITISCGDPNGLTVNSGNVSTVDYSIAEQLLRAVEGACSTTAVNVRV